MENRLKSIISKLFSSANVDEQPPAKLIYVRESAFGTKQNKGYLFEEYSDRFKNRYEKFAMFMRMDNDGQVFQMRNAISLMKVSTNFHVDPFVEEGQEPSPKDIEIQKFVEKALFTKLDQGFKGLLEEITLYVRDGFSLFELYFQKDRDGKYYPKLTRIAAETVLKWRTNNDEPGIRQLAFYPKGADETSGENENVDQTGIDIPASKLLLFNINAEGTNYEGRSIYRKVAKDWYFKDRFENYHATLQERMAIPPVAVTVPQGTPEDKQKFYQEVGENIRSFENGAVVQEINDDGKVVVKYEFMESKIGDNANKLTEAIKHYQQNINDIFFEQFLYLGKSEKGSYGMAGASTSFFFQAVASLLEKDIEIINRYLIPKMVALNFGVVDRYPQLKFGQVGFTDEGGLATTLGGLVSNGLLTANYQTEKYIRELMHLPALSEEEYEEIKEKAAEALNPAPAMDEAAMEEDEGETADLEEMEDVDIDDTELSSLEEELDSLGEEADFSLVGEHIVEIFSDFTEAMTFKAPMSAETKKKISEALKKKGGTEEVEAVKSKTQEGLDNLNEEISNARDDFNNKVSDIIDSISTLKDSIKGKNKSKVKAQIKVLRAKIKEARAAQKAFMKKKQEQKKMLKLLKQEATKEIRERKKAEAEKKRKERESISAQKKADREAAAKKRAEEKAAKTTKKSSEHVHTADCGCSKVSIFSDIVFDHNAIIDHQVQDQEPGETVGARNFSDPIQEGFWRPLTFAERRVEIKSIKENLNSEQEEMLKKYSEIADSMSEKMLAQVQKAVETNNYDALVELSAKYKTDISTLVTTVYKKMFDYGKNEASREIGVQIPSTKKDLKDVIKIQADNIAEGITSKVTTEAKSVIAGAIVKADGITNTSSAGVVLNVKKAIKPVIDQAFGVVNTVAIGQAFNSGRKSVAYINPTKVYAAQYSAILDERTSNRCLSLDGTVVKVDSDDYKNYSPPQHVHCRSMWVFINEDEEYKPDITDVDRSIPVKDTLTSKEELKVPVIAKGSPAVAVLQKEIDQRVAKNDSLVGKRKEKNVEIINRLKKAIE